MMVTNQYQELRGLILDMIVPKALNDDCTPVDCPPTGAAKSHLDLTFEGLYDSNDSESKDKEEDDAVNKNSI